jgi:hypothetical protein
VAMGEGLQGSPPPLEQVGEPGLWVVCELLQKSREEGKEEGQQGACCVPTPSPPS